MDQGEIAGLTDRSEVRDYRYYLSPSVSVINFRLSPFNTGTGCRSSARRSKLLRLALISSIVVVLGINTNPKVCSASLSSLTITVAFSISSDGRDFASPG